MQSTSLTTLAAERLAAAREAASGRSAQAIYGGHDHALRQTLLALAAGQELAEHESPGEATLQVLHGRVRLATADDVWEGGAGDYVVIPSARHSLTAIEDAAVILTVVAGSR